MPGSCWDTAVRSVFLRGRIAKVQFTRLLLVSVRLREAILEWTAKSYTPRRS
jgi:hypothetical protein